VSDRVKPIVERVIKECGSQWRDFKEPMSVLDIGALINRQLVDALGAGWNAGRLIDWLASKNIVKLIRTKTGKRWAVLFSLWESLSDLERKELLARCELLVDPLSERQAVLKANRLSKRSTP
jgi:hypothetical protein